jgi:hypothetical protein
MENEDDAERASVLPSIDRKIEYIGRIHELPGNVSVDHLSEVGGRAESLEKSNCTAARADPSKLLTNDHTANQVSQGSLHEQK